MCATSRKARQAAAAETEEGCGRGSKLVFILVGKQARPQLMGGKPQIFAHPCDKKKSAMSGKLIRIRSRHPCDSIISETLFYVLLRKEKHSRCGVEQGNPPLRHQGPPKATKKSILHRNKGDKKISLSVGIGNCASHEDSSPRACPRWPNSPTAGNLNLRSGFSAPQVTSRSNACRDRSVTSVQMCLTEQNTEGSRGYHKAHLEGYSGSRSKNKIRKRSTQKPRSQTK